MLGLLDGVVARAAEACDAPALNGLMTAGPGAWSALRSGLSAVLRADGPAIHARPTLGERVLAPMHDVELYVPAAVGDYTDFYASVHHATNVGRMFRPDTPLLPNYKYVPIGYHGRASSIVPSGTPVRRPSGQVKDPSAPDAPPTFAPARSLDYEAEVGIFIGQGNPLGEPIAIDDADERIFGFCVVNDWSARDIQTWEYQPLGPFLAKSFATTVSPWVVTREALAPFRAPAYVRPSEDPAPLPYLDSPDDRALGGVALTLEVYLASRAMRTEGVSPIRLSRASFTEMYWTPAQLVAHHASNGCNLRPGDLLASGTVSGAGKDERGCLLELTWRGTEPLTLPTGEQRRFLADGDEVSMRAYCERAGHRRIGFGECRGEVVG
jgi:fumarylacetoacetase